MLKVQKFFQWHGEKRSNVIQPVYMMEFYHHRDLIGSPLTFIKGKLVE